MSDHQAIKNCPFCDAKMNGDSNYMEHPVNGCFISEWEFDRPDIAAWNRRAAPTSEPVAVDRDAVTRLDVMNMIRAQMHRVYASAIDREDIDTRYMEEIEDAVRTLFKERTESVAELECLQMKYGMMRTTYEVELSQVRSTLAPAAPEVPAPAASDEGDFASYTRMQLIEDIDCLRRANDNAMQGEQAQPVAWAVVSKKGGIHKLAITRESADRKASVWQEEWPNNGCTVRPLVFGNSTEQGEG